MIGGGVIAAGELLLEPAREVMLRARAAPGRDAVRVEAARVRRRGGDDRRGAAGARARPTGVADRARSRPRRVSAGRPGRLPDADREPRGRHAARARRAARGRRRRLRGHAPHARAARALRRAGDARLLPRAQRARAGGASWSSGCAAARSWRWCRDAGMPLVSDPGLRARAGLRRRGAGGRGAARAVGGARRAGGQRRCRPTRGASPGFLPRKRGALEAVFALAGDASWRSSRRAASARRWRVLAELDPRAARRGLPRADQAARGGRARHAPPSSPRATRRRRRAARSCS